MATAAQSHQDLRDAIRDLCAQFPDSYFREVDEKRGYPDAFVDALTRAGWLAALIPQDYGGSGLGLTEASVIMEEINHARRQFGRLPRADVQHGHAAAAWLGGAEARLPAEDRERRIAAAVDGRHRADHRHRHDEAQHDRGARGDRYVVNGQKVWISRVQHSDLMILLARTTPLDEVTKRSEGMSTFIVDLREAIGHGLTVQPIANMVNHETNELFFDNLEVPAENLIGEEGQGFRYILDGLNAERTLIAAECIGDGYWFIDKVTAYAKERIVFGRPIGQNQGVQFPIARATPNSKPRA